MPALIGCLSSIEILWQSSVLDLFHDAALFGSEALLEVIKISRNMVPELCLGEAKDLEEILAYYPADCRVCLSYQLVMHQLQLIEGKKLNKNATDALLDCLNTYCATSDADIDLHSFVYPKHPLKRALLIVDWLKNFPHKIDNLHIPCSEITKIVLANHLALNNINFKPDALIEEFDCLDFEEKKRFIVKILLAKKIEVLKGKNKTYFLQSVKKKCGSDLAASFKLALLAIGFIYCKSFSHETIPSLNHFELSSEITNLSDDDKKWFLDNIILDEGGLAFFPRPIDHTFFSILNNFKSCLESEFISPKLSIVEEKILEICPVEHALDALTNLGKGDKLIPSLKKYVLGKLAVIGFDSSLALICKKFF